MKYLSVCSGIEAATVAWHSLGWQPLAFSEIEKFPRKILTHHYPDVPLHGDFTVLREQEWIKDADILVGGTPCQAFSVAGLRNSLDDDRGNLTLEFVRLADAIDNLQRIGTIIVWENVPGVLSVKDNAFGCFLGALVGNDDPIVPTGGKWTNAGMVMGPKRRAAWRVLDAQYFGVAQRRRRVFVIASARDDFDPAEVLFERKGLRRDTPPRRKSGEKITECTGTLTANGGGLNRPAGNANELDFCVPTYVAKTLTAGVGQRYDPETESLICGALGAWTGLSQGVQDASARHDSSPCADRGQNMVNQSMAVRRLTPVECERLQGFPDDYTNISGAADGPRYKALGNSMAVPVMAWIGKRINLNVKTISADHPFDECPTETVKESE
jgi:DNA (cytosine-5)-methyltransferase 1